MTIAKIERSTIHGEIEVSGAKNSFFPAVGAGIALGAKKIKIRNVPRIDDVMTMLKILRKMGCSISMKGNNLVICTDDMKPVEIDRDDFGKIRGSVIIFGAMLSRFGRAKIPMPGGCRIGKRPIDQHVKAAKSLGFSVSEENGIILAEGEPHGAKISFDIKTVTGTENAILMSIFSGAEIRNPAEEPEVQELINYLRKYGVEIEKEKSRIFIGGMKGTPPEEVEFSLIPDRIEAGTWLIATASTGGELTIKNVIPEHLAELIRTLREAGVKIKVSENSIHLVGKDRYMPLDIVAEPYPGFPTDMQPQICVMLFKAKGKSTIRDKIFPERITHVEELRKMGGKINAQNGMINVFPSKLCGTEIVAKDLRSAAALVIAGLTSEQHPTFILNFDIINRGYENFVRKLRSVGGKIKLIRRKQKIDIVKRKHVELVNYVVSGKGEGQENVSYPY